MTSSTDILVRGESANWLEPGFGRKELRLADLIRRGHTAVVLHDFEFRRLVEQGRAARTLDMIAGHTVSELLVGRKDGGGAREPFAGQLDGSRKVGYRGEQPELRRRLPSGRKVSSCAICGETLPVSLLVAAHKKPHAYCTQAEKRDLENIAFAVCMLGCDALYERGYLTVDERGRILASGGERLPRHLRSRLRQLRGLQCSAFDEQSAGYFDWHRKRRFHG